MSRGLVALVSSGIDAYQSGLMARMRSVLTDRGLSLILYCCTPYSPGLPSSLVALLRTGQLRGIITTAVSLASDEEELDRQVAELKLPLVRINKMVAGTTCVRGDNVNGMRALVAHLVKDCGMHRPMLVRGLAHQPDSVEREAAIRESLTAHNIRIDEDLVVDGMFRNDIALREVRNVLARRTDMDAIIAFNDQMALGVLDALVDMDLDIPGRVMVTGFDDEPVAATAWPGITTVSQDLPGQGVVAVKALLAKMDGQAVPDEIVTPCHLVVRGSTVPFDRIGTDRVTAAIAGMRAAQQRVALQDALMGLNRALLPCQTVDQVVATLSAQLAEIDVDRCFIAIHETPAETPSAGAGPSAALTRLVMDYRDGKRFPPTAELFPVNHLLPDRLRCELDKGILAVLPVMSGSLELGYIMLERVSGYGLVRQGLHLDLSRTLEAVISAGRLKEHAEGMELLVAARTRELMAEVIGRRQAEEQLQTANAELQRSLLLDGLTRIANRVAFQQHLEHSLQELADTGREVALLLVDVDLFKQYNDHYGHVAGDRALQAIACCLSKAVRQHHDLACRYGGEEFAIILPDCEAGEAHAVALRLRGLVAEAAIPHELSPVSNIVTVSIGVATTRPTSGLQLEDFVKVADEAMYQAKRLGRDRIWAARGVLDRVGCENAPLAFDPRRTNPKRT